MGIPTCSQLGMGVGASTCSRQETPAWASPQKQDLIANPLFVAGRYLETLFNSCVFVGTTLLLAKCFWEARKLTSSRVQFGAPRGRLARRAKSEAIGFSLWAN